MAKIAYSKLKIKKNSTVTIVTYALDENTSFDIEVKNYLPVSDKLDLIGKVISYAADENKFYNVGKLDILLAEQIMFYYTNLSFTESAQENVAELYDEIVSSGLYNMVAEVLQETGEFGWLKSVLMDTVDSIYKYQNSAMGILEAVTTNYAALGMEASEVQKALTNPESLNLVKDILTKLG